MDGRAGRGMLDLHRLSFLVDYAACRKAKNYFLPIRPKFAIEKPQYCIATQFIEHVKFLRSQSQFLFVFL
ncbi:hypothetical protein D1224_14085 [Henriciella barbarensis]|uniref:Uncharacterized protein n=1 Tax=Henriciella barbarensis TaxID=86342 RepID=A0A399QR78_9PROT|nr:hypothetical protein D1224_14085 [Henriciella barbarensis]